MPVGKTIADGYIELRLDDSKLDADTKTKVAKVTNTFGSRLNKELQALDIDPIDLQASPRDALRAIDRVDDKLRELSRNAPTLELKVQADRALGQLNVFTKKFGDLGPQAAVTFAGKLSQRLDPLIAAMPLGGPMGVAVAGAAVAAAPLLAATLSGAIIGGVGIGGVIGGLTLAAKDQRVKEATKGLGDRLEARLFAAGGAFVDPALAGLEDIERAVDSIDLGRIARQSAELVQPLTAGAASAITDIGDAIEGLTEKAGPPVRAISDGIAQIGESASEGLGSLTDNAEGSADALRTVFSLVGYGITTTFQLVNALTELYEINKKIGGDFGLQLLLKVTGAEMDKTGDSARRTGAGTFGMSQKMIEAAASAEDLKVKQEALKAVQDRAKASQDALAGTLDALGGKTSFAARTSDALRTAMDNLYGASIRQTDANEAYQASWDELSASVKANKGTLDIHSAAGRANRNVLEGLLTSNNDLYVANVAAGQSVESARKKHEARTAAIVKEAEKLGLNRNKTRELIETYGQIPPKKATDLVVEGINQVVIELKRIYLAQRALAEGKTIGQVRYEGSAAMRSLLAGGGHVQGPGGPTDDKIPAMLSDGEYVVKAASTSKIGVDQLDYLNKHGELPAFAIGGLVETSRRMRFPVNVRDAYVMPRAEALRRVAPVFGDWPSSPSAQRGDSGVWRRVLQLIHSGPHSGSFGNAYRAGDPKWHGSGRAVDWMGFNQDALATFLAAKRPLELIHRTSRRDYAYTRGVNKGSFNNALMNAHKNHIHIAMRDGGEVSSRLLPFGSYDTGGKLPTGLSLAYNGTGRPEPVGHGLAGETHFHFHGPVASRQAAEDMVVEGYRAAQRKRRLP